MSEFTRPENSLPMRDMLIVRSSKKFMLEKAYVWKVLLEDFLGLSYQCDFDDSLTDYHIQLENGAELIVSDAFFSRRAEEAYVTEEFIPQTVAWFDHALTNHSPIPVIYGSPECTVGEKEADCKIDFVASSFFMLARWEEYVVEQRDEHGRFPLNASLAYRAGFHQQPVVNQYLELLWRLLYHLDPSLTRKKRSFRLVPTHDVERIRRWRGLGPTFSVPFYSLTIEKKPRRALRHLQNILEVKAGLKDDPYDTFDYLMRASEKFGLQSRFFFLSGGETKHDNYYRIDQRRVQDLLETINNRGHRIGLCSSYNSYTRPLLWEQERDTLRALAPQQINKGRQHYLRFEVPTTWQIWNDAGMSVDSSLGYAEQPGFRCGTCYAFPVFNFITREALSVYESPLICSETSLIDYMQLSPSAAEQEVHRVYAQVQQYQGNFVLQWHNSSLFTEEHTPYRQLYEKILRGW